MKILLCIFGLVLLCDNIAVSAQGKRECPDTETGLDFVPNQLIVVFNKGTEPDRIFKINESLNVKVLQKIGRIVVIEVPEGESMEALCEKYFEKFPEEVIAINLNLIGIRPLEEKP